MDRNEKLAEAVKKYVELSGQLSFSDLRDGYNAYIAADKKCPSCNNWARASKAGMYPGTHFCPECGRKFEDAEENFMQTKGVCKIHGEYYGLQCSTCSPLKPEGFVSEKEPEQIKPISFKKLVPFESEEDESILVLYRVVSEIRDRVQKLMGIIYLITPKGRRYETTA